MMRIRMVYASLAIAVLAIETGIAAFVHDGFVRPYLGDSLAVILVYLAIRAVTGLGVWAAVASALAIAVGLEFGQWFDLLGAFGWEQSALARTVLGHGFDPKDFAAYAGGGVAVLICEAIVARFRR